MKNDVFFDVSLECLLARTSDHPGGLPPSGSVGPSIAPPPCSGEPLVVKPFDCKAVGR